jgi:hypothetical protein
MGATVPAESSPGPTHVSPSLSLMPLLPPAENPTASTCAETGDAALGPTPQPGRPSGWPVMLGDWAQVPVFGPSGTMYQVQDMKLVAIDATGHEPAGWPMPLSVPPVSDNGYAPTYVSVGPDGTVYVTGGNLIYAFHPDGTQVKGWPYRAPVNSECLACTAALVPVAQGLYTNIDPGKIELLGPSGVQLPGWPVSLPNVSDSSNLQLWVGPDGTLYSEDRLAGTIYAYGADGAAKPGWPLQGWSGMTFDPSGRIYVWKYKFGAPPGARYSGPAIQTKIGALDPAGRFYTGWPMTFDGPVAQPVFAPDGTVYMTRGTSYGPGSATPPGPGGTILAFDPFGKPKPGWPASLPAGYWAVGSLPGVSQVSSDPPTIATDGTVYVMATPSDETPPANAIIEAFNPQGQLLAGWPRAIPFDQLSNAQAGGAGSGWLMAGQGGTVYLISDNRILALRSGGPVTRGWPLARPCGQAPSLVEPSPDGGLLVIWDLGAKPYQGAMAIRYRPDGSIANS